MSRETALTTENAPEMAISDSWHRALVYFGLAEEYEDEYDGYEPEPDPEEPYRERPNVRRLRRRRDEIDDIFGDEEPRGGRQTTVLRPVRQAAGPARSNGDVRVHL